MSNKRELAKLAKEIRQIKKALSNNNEAIFQSIMDEFDGSIFLDDRRDFMVGDDYLRIPITTGGFESSYGDLVDFAEEIEEDFRDSIRGTLKRFGRGFTYEVDLPWIIVKIK